MKIKKSVICVLLFSILSFIPHVYAVDMNARDFFTQPAGVWSSVSYLGFDHSNRFQGPDNDNNAKMNVASFVHRLVRFTDCGGITCSPQIVIPALNMDIKGPGESSTTSKAGIGDISLGSGIWLINNPKERRFLGILPTIVIPTGQYKSNRPGTSAGGNRWQFHLNMNNTWALSEKWTMELEAEAQFYSKNDDYLGKSYRQNPMYKLKSYVSYDINPENYLALKIIHGFGGKGKLDGNKIANTNMQLTQTGIELGHLLTNNSHLLFAYTRDINAKNTFQGDHVQVRFAYSF